ncbi:HAD family hydrolase [Roseibium sp.]|uniref:HAD family hydrolase n=1 Tax=Roseibium sp. TaxID=1936156 RepID=UPI003A97D141
MIQVSQAVSQIRAILFDKDGTLLDFDRTWCDINNSAARHAAHGDRRLADHLLRIAGQDPDTGTTIAGSLFAAGNAREIAQEWIDAGADFALHALTKDLDSIFSEGMREAVPLPGVPEVFSHLHQLDLHLGIASSDAEASIRIFVKTLGAVEQLAFIAGYDSGHGPKPEPGMLLAFARQLKLDPRQIAMVGDNTHDLELARAANAGLAIGVLSGTGKQSDLEPLADLILDSVADLPGLFS